MVTGVTQQTLMNRIFIVEHRKNSEAMRFFSLSFYSFLFFFLLCPCICPCRCIVVHEILSCCVDFDMNWVSYLDAAPKSIDSAMHESARFPRRELPSLKCHRAVFVTRGC